MSVPTPRSAPADAEAAITAAEISVAEITAAEVARLQAQVAELEARWRVTVAGQHERRDREVAQLVAAHQAAAAALWRPVLDTLDTALTDAADRPSLVAAVETARAQAALVLAGLGHPASV